MVSPGPPLVGCGRARPCSLLLLLGRRVEVDRGQAWCGCVLTVCLVGERDEPGRNEPVSVVVWWEDGRVRLAPGWNIPLRCGLAPSVKIWGTESLQPGWLF
jgi:hypothetical protein